uniref:Uncharacterized protein n=1 Tax=Caenorhabditis japonica TaxID=281687 RepID=A0A8R1IE59_CAEJA
MSEWLRRLTRNQLGSARVDATSSAMTSSRGYHRVDSSDVASLLMQEEDDNPHEALLQRNGDDYASTYHHMGVEYDSDEELERNEMDDRVAEIPEGFHRRQRRRLIIRQNGVCGLTFS